MERATIQFIAAVIAGLVVMILFAGVTVNLMQSIPIAGPFVGGLVAGAIAGTRRDYLRGGLAGAVAGLLGAVVVAADLMADTSLLRIAVPPFPKLAGFLFLVVAVFYFPILAFIGGVFGGMVRR